MSVPNASGSLWDFGDDNTSTQSDPSHTYLTSGVYPVTLTVTNACGSVNLTQEVTIDLDPAATFTATIVPGIGATGWVSCSANSLSPAYRASTTKSQPWSPRPT